LAKSDTGIIIVY